jgi:hypothetical protein
MEENEMGGFKAIAMIFLIIALPVTIGWLLFRWGGALIALHIMYCNVIVDKPISVPFVISCILLQLGITYLDNRNK